MLARLLCIPLLTALLISPAMAELPQSQEQITLSFAPIVRSASPAVVNIFTETRTRQQMANPLFADPMFRQFFGDMFPMPPMQRERVENSLGSGVVVDASGLVVTNSHVVRGATSIKVVLQDRREFPAEMVINDPETDLALLRLRGASKLPVLPLGNSDELQVGDLVLAIGNPFGIGQTVTSGIVSAVARTGVGISDFNYFIQTDAAINPGNSGGALVDMRGRLVGINTAIFSRDGGSLGIGFAVPVNMVRAVINSPGRNGQVQRPWLGAGLQNITPELADSLGLERPSGALVANVAPNSPASRAGLQRGDVITSINKQPIDDSEALRFRMATLSAGQNVPLAIIRAGAPQELLLAVEYPSAATTATRRLAGKHPLDGVEVAVLNPALAEQRRLSSDSGIVVLNVPRGAVAGRFGIRADDIILGVNGVQPSNLDELERALMRGNRGGWRIDLTRNGQLLQLVIR